jgi:hypothetical protein
LAIANAPISSDDDDAITKLQAKIKAAEKDQQFMKAANKIAKSKKLDEGQKINSLTQMGISEFTARQLLQPDYMGRVGFASYQLTNNNANIRRMKKRIIGLESEFNRDEIEDWKISIKGVEATASENQEANRLQLFFDGKPPSEVITILKANGFKFSRREGNAWQRLLNDNARRTLQYIQD